MKQRKIKDSKNPDPSTGNAQSPEATMKRFKKYITPELCEEIGKVFVFELSGDDPGTFHLDLKSGNVGKGSPEQVDVTMKMSGSDFVEMVNGTLNSTAAFMGGRLKIEGDMFVAMKLESVMKKLQKMESS